MSDTTYDELVDTFQDVLPSLTVDQAQRLNEFWELHDLESCHFLLSFYSKYYREEETDTA